MAHATSKSLALFLRVIGIAGLFALPCALMPTSWMDTTHQWLGLGDLPTGPIVGYLARSTSLFYALVGGLTVLISYDVERYQPIIAYLGVSVLVLGAVLLGVDISEGLPWWWSIGEGIGNAAIGIAIVWFARQLPKNPSGAASNESSS